MEALLQSFGLVFVSEMGDKTQLLALVLALRFKKPVAVLLGILCATLLNHGVATLLGGWVGSLVSPDNLKIALAVLFLIFAVWILIPDKLDEDDVEENRAPRSAFLTTLILFFFAEMGDKTQLATLALGARFQAPIIVTVGTTLAMLAADGLAVFFGERITRVVPMNIVRILSAISFAAFGAAIYFS